MVVAALKKTVMLVNRATPQHRARRRGRQGPSSGSSTGEEGLPFSEHV